MKDLIGRPKLSGGYEEDLENSFQVLHALTSMCQVRDEEKWRALPIMLTGDALSVYQGNPINLSHTTIPEYYYRIGIIEMKRG